LSSHCYCGKRLTFLVILGPPPKKHFKLKRDYINGDLRLLLLLKANIPSCSFGKQSMRHLRFFNNLHVKHSVSTLNLCNKQLQLSLSLSLRQCCCNQTQLFPGCYSVFSCEYNAHTQGNYTEMCCHTKFSIL